ncbi:hypothetical protein [Chryseobacterium sp. MFBS3-17]|uniref:hypothetical protein n=1 Tax=Chryseobacterium sp. MFBS3-17 TaxID=2886689 RepID=UPI001D0EAE81|nr:hypothetical protein [Chryseobacterium sp. MFBS3-17]MCC2591385.1 hypothetical protein [Chryseobacterium sp. MFBS3-17]
MINNYYKLKFLLIMIYELVFLPILMIYEEYKKIVSSRKPLNVTKRREIVQNKRIFINIHEWGGYDYERKKEIKGVIPFKCGLKHQLERFKNNQCKYEKVINVTISEIEKFKYLDQVKEYGCNVESVSNKGMDFSGYEYFYNNVKYEPNAFVILTNSSVHKEQTIFLNTYVQYMERNTDVAILGVSYCAKRMQTLVRNNFTPHLQSFFLLTTIKVLEEIVEANGNKFPGSGINHKLLLIREGEIKISRIALKLGYNLAVTQHDGSVFKFGQNSATDNGWKRWTLKKTDVRLFLKKPNLINEIT